MGRRNNPPPSPDGDDEPEEVRISTLQLLSSCGHLRTNAGTVPVVYGGSGG